MSFYVGIGSRQTPPNILKLMTHIAQRLAKEGYTLRSGGADGADTAFEAGAGDSKEIYLPWPNFNKNKSKLNHPTKEAFDIAQKLHPAWHKLTPGGKALHARNVHQVLGLDLENPVCADFIVCWTTDGAIVGGTGQALRLAMKLKLPIYNLARTPFICPVCKQLEIYHPSELC